MSLSDKKKRSEQLLQEEILSGNTKGTDPVTWDSKFSTQLFFILGLTEGSQSPSQDIIEENNIHGDILVENFIDNYLNLTLKSVFMLKYFKDSCNSAKFFIKVDDDVFLHIPKLQDILSNASLPSDMILGRLNCGGRPISDPRHKWHAPRYLFPYSQYPEYMGGASYIISATMVTPLFNVAMATPLFHVEDVFVTGICAAKLGVCLVDNAGFHYTELPVNACWHQKAIMSHGLSPSSMDRLWKLLALEAKIGVCKPLSDLKTRQHFFPYCKNSNRTCD